MNQVEFNIRSSAHAEELKWIKKRYAPLKDAALAKDDEDEYDRLDDAQAAEEKAACARFNADTAGPITPGF